MNDVPPLPVLSQTLSELVDGVLGWIIEKVEAGEGVSVLMISSDMEEVIGVSTRVAVMRRGRIVGMLQRDDLCEEAILQLAVE